MPQVLSLSNWVVSCRPLHRGVFLMYILTKWNLSYIAKAAEDWGCGGRKKFPKTLTLGSDFRLCLGCLVKSETSLTLEDTQ